MRKSPDAAQRANSLGSSLAGLSVSGRPVNTGLASRVDTLRISRKEVTKVEKLDLDYIGKYAKRLNDAGGNLSTLSNEERKHLKLLIRKWEIEQDLAELETELRQGKLL